MRNISKIRPILQFETLRQTKRLSKLSKASKGNIHQGEIKVQIFLALAVLSQIFHQCYPKFGNVYAKSGRHEFQLEEIHPP